MKRARTWFLRALFAAALLAGAAVVFYLAFLPGIVERRIVAALRDAGLPGASVRVRAVSPSTMSLSDLTLGDAIRVAAVRDEHSLATLRAGRVSRIELIGLEWTIRVRDGRIDWGLPGGSGGGQSKPAGPLDLPFSEAVLRAGVVTIDLDGRPVRVPIEGSLVRDPDGGLHLAASSPAILAAGFAAEGVAIQLDATVTPDRRAAGLRGSLKIARVAGLRQPLPGLPLEARDVSLEITQDGERLTYVAHASIQPDWLVRAEGAVEHLPGVSSLPNPRPAATLSLDARGPLPEALRRELAERGVHVEKLGQVTLTARADAAAGVPASEQAPGEPWRVQLREARLTAGGAEGVLRASGAAAAGAKIDLKLAGEGGPAGFRLTALPDSAVSFDSLAASGVNASHGRATLAGDAAWAPNRPLAYDARAALSAPRLEIPAAAVVLSGLTAALPLVSPAPAAATTPTPAQGEFRIAGVSWRETEMPAITGTLALAGRRAEVSAAWPVLDGAALTAKAWLDWAGAAPMGEAAVSLPRYAIRDPHAVANLLPQLQGMTVEGALSFDARVKLAGGKLEPLVRVKVEDARFESAQLDASAEGVSGELLIDRLTPPGSPGGQTFKVGRAKSGDLVLSDGDVAFRIEDGHTFFVERCAFTLGSGTFRAHAFRFDTRKELLATEVFLEDVNLRDWLALLTKGKLTGEGEVYGRLPVALQLGKHKAVAIGSGFLFAEPGAGWVQVHDGEALDTVLEQAGLPGAPAAKPPAAPGAVDPNQIAAQVDLRRRITEALRNFEYTYLRLHLDRAGGETVPRVEVRGAGRHGDRQALNLNLTIPGNWFDVMLNTALFRQPREPGPRVDEALEGLATRPAAGPGDNSAAATRPAAIDGKDTQP